MGVETFVVRLSRIDRRYVWSPFAVIHLMAFIFCVHSSQWARLTPITFTHCGIAIRRSMNFQGREASEPGSWCPIRTSVNIFGSDKHVSALITSTTLDQPNLLSDYSVQGLESLFRSCRENTILRLSLVSFTFVSCCKRAPSVNSIGM